MKKDSFAAPDNYYHSLKDNHNLEDERKLSGKDKEITVPLLYIGQTGDWVCRTDLMSDAKEAGLIKAGIEEKVVNAGYVPFRPIIWDARWQLCPSALQPLVPVWGRLLTGRSPSDVHSDLVGYLLTVIDSRWASGSGHRVAGEALSCERVRLGVCLIAWWLPGTALWGSRDDVVLRFRRPIRRRFQHPRDRFFHCMPRHLLLLFPVDLFYLSTHDLGLLSTPSHVCKMER